MIKPFAARRSHNRVIVDGWTVRADASELTFCSPRDASNTNTRYCVNVTSLSTAASDRAATPTNARDARRTPSVTSVGVIHAA